MARSPHGRTGSRGHASEVRAPAYCVDFGKPANYWAAGRVVGAATLGCVAGAAACGSGLRTTTTQLKACAFRSRSTLGSAKVNGSAGLVVGAAAADKVSSLNVHASVGSTGLVAGDKSLKASP